jgi:hypothetical protein
LHLNPPTPFREFQEFHPSSRRLQMQFADSLISFPSIKATLTSVKAALIAIVVTLVAMIVASIAPFISFA